MELSPPVISIDIKPHHLFRYPSEWDPRQNGKTKGGYLEGKIYLPRGRNLRVVLSTHPEQPHNIPKTEARAAGDDVSLKKLLESRISNPEVLKALTEKYSKKKSVNLKKVRLRVDVFCLDSGVLLGSSISYTASKAHGAMDLHDATPLRSCARGGRKVCMIAEFAFAKDVQPRFQLYDSEGRRLHEKEETLLQQPNPSDVCVLKESIIFITPVQDHAEELYRKKYKIKLVAQRQSDGYVSKKKFDFKYLPHDYYTPTCYLCEFDPDNNEEQGVAQLVPLKEVARPGLRKRNMSDNEVPDLKIKKCNQESPLKVSPIQFPSTPMPPLILSHERRILSPQEKPKVIVSSANSFVETIIKEEPTDEEEILTSLKSSPSSQTTDFSNNVPTSNLQSIPVYDLSKATIRTWTLPVTTASLIIPTTDIKKE